MSNQPRSNALNGSWLPPTGWEWLVTFAPRSTGCGGYLRVSSTRLALGALSISPLGLPPIRVTWPATTNDRASRSSYREVQGSDHFSSTSRADFEHGTGPCQPPYSKATHRASCPRRLRAFLVLTDGRCLAVDLHRQGDLAVPNDLHRDTTRQPARSRIPGRAFGPRCGVPVQQAALAPPPPGPPAAAGSWQLDQIQTS
jgi:hypothetical protein